MRGLCFCVRQLSLSVLVQTLQLRRQLLRIQWGLALHSDGDLKDLYMNMWIDAWRMDASVSARACMHSCSIHTYKHASTHKRMYVCSVHTRTHTDMHLVPTRTNTNARATRGYTCTQTTLTIRCSGDACHSSPFDFLPLVGMSLTQSRINTHNTHTCVLVCMSVIIYLPRLGMLVHGSIS